MTVYESYMATKTITLELDAYDRLRTAKRSPRESFSEVVRRLAIPRDAVTGRQLLSMCRTRGAQLTEEDCRAIDRLNAEDQPPAIP